MLEATPRKLENVASSSRWTGSHAWPGNNWFLFPLAVWLLITWTGDQLLCYVFQLYTKPSSQYSIVISRGMLLQRYHTCLPPLRSVVQIPDLAWESWLLLSDGRQFTVSSVSSYIGFYRH